MVKTAFIIGVLLGLAGVVAGAAFYPWIDHPRVASRTTVLPNGGRRERFVIRLPVDQISSFGSPEMGVRAGPFPDGLGLPEEFGPEPLLVEHFKVRDVEGNVIGLAVRHTSGFADDAAVWAVAIPARGALTLVGAGNPPGLDAALERSGRAAGEAWSGDLRLTLGPEEEPSGRVTWGSDEFGGLSGTYEESWILTGVAADGELQGTIELETIIYRQP